MSIAQAINDCLRLLEAQPDDARTLLKLGDLLLREGQTVRARESYSRAVDAFELRGDLQKARAVQQQVVSILDAAPNSTKADKSAARLRLVGLEARIKPG